MSGKRPVLTGRGRESEAKTESRPAIEPSGINKKGPLERFAQGARESSGDLLSRTRGPGTIGDLRLNFRVRDGNGCDPHSITAETNSCMEPKLFAISRMPKQGGSGLPTRDSRTKSLKERKSVSRAISTARLNVSPRLHLRPIDVVVSDGPSGGCPRET